VEGPRAAVLSRWAIVVLAVAAVHAVPAFAVEALLPVHVDLTKGRILITLPAPDRDGIYGRYLYAASMQTGLDVAALIRDRLRRVVAHLGAAQGDDADAACPSSSGIRNS
jgi:hypothetical protein